MLTIISVSALLTLRNDGRILKLPPYLSLFVILVGVTWLFLLPLNEYSRHTYISENALLPGQVHTYFGGSEHNVFRAYRHEVASLKDVDDVWRIAVLEKILREAGLKVARQDYAYSSAGEARNGTNVYAILQGPRADATEAIVLIGAWRNMDNEINYSGVALVLSLARYFKRWSLWSKDIIFLISGDSTAGPQAWVDAYHASTPLRNADPLTLRSGALQGAVAIDYPAGPWGHRFDKLHVLYDGVNGQLPNLDLFNTAVSIASGQMGIGTTLQRMWSHDDSYADRLRTMLRGMMSQGLGQGNGAHSAFIPYHVDAITLQTTGDGWHDEMSLGRTVESLFRSLNNLLEHLHQSFFFYLLMQADRFVSIGTYLPSAMLIAVNFTITAIALWVKSGRPSPSSTANDTKAGEEKPGLSTTAAAANDEKTSSATDTSTKQPEMVLVQSGPLKALVPASTLEVAERKLFIPFALVLATHFLGLLPLSLFATLPVSLLGPTFMTFGLLSTITPFAAAITWKRLAGGPTPQERVLMQCLSLLLLGMFLSALATLNFSLAFFVGLFASPLSFVRPLTQPAEHLSPAKTTAKNNAIRRSRTTNDNILRLAVAGLSSLTLILASPMSVTMLACWYWQTPLGEVLSQASFGWHVWGVWTGVVVWLVWWPAWLVGAMLVGLSF